ncbi:hypothetical protein D3C71_1654820 [compost metagenome]
MLDAVQQILVVSMSHMLPDKGLQPIPLGFEEQGRLVDVGRVIWVVDHPVALWIVVQVGTRLQHHPVIQHGGVEVVEQRRVRPGLVRGMRAFALAGPSPSPRPDDPVLLAHPRFRPLLEFDNDHLGLALLVQAGD